MLRALPEYRVKRPLRADALYVSPERLVVAIIRLAGGCRMRRSGKAEEHG
jgi:hypothetical protein